MPDSERPDACEVLRALGGSAPWSQLLLHTTRHSLRRALRAELITHVGAGVYALPETPPAHAAATALRGLVSHESAAQHWRLETLRPVTGLHVTVPRSARPHPIRRVTVHYADVAPSDDLYGVTSPLRCVLDCARTLPFADALAIADSALRRAVITTEELVTAALRRRGAGRSGIMRVASAADGRAANPLESGLRAIILDAGLTGFEPQYGVELTGGGTAWVDLGDPRRAVALEAEGFEFHGTREALIRDCRRYDELVRAGWTVLRFCWQHVTLEQAWVAAVVGEACSFRRRRPDTLPNS